MTGVASSTNGEIIYVSISGGTTGIIRSINNGNTWSSVYASSVFSSIACSSDGSIVYGVILGGDGVSSIYKSTDIGTTWTPVIFTPNNTLPGGSSNPESPEV
jgi:hypothetical protein